MVGAGEHGGWTERWERWGSQDWEGTGRPLALGGQRDCFMRWGPHIEAMSGPLELEPP